MSEINNDELVMYLVVNIDLIREYSMSSGKIAAQVAHGATMISFKYSQEDFYKEWYADGRHQKKIVLRAHEKDLKKLIELDGVAVYDNGYTEIPEGSLTVVAFPPMLRSETPKLLKRLQTFHN